MHKCYCGHTTRCDCGMTPEDIMKKFTSKESTIIWIEELVKVKSIEYANWAEENRRMIGLSDEGLYEYYQSTVIERLVLNKNKEEGHKLCKEWGFHMVVTKEDDERFFITADMDPKRVKVVIKDNIIISAAIG